MGLIDPGSLNQVPTLGVECLRVSAHNKNRVPSKGSLYGDTARVCKGFHLGASTIRMNRALGYIMEYLHSYIGRTIIGYVFLLIVRVPILNRKNTRILPVLI